MNESSQPNQSSDQIREHIDQTRQNMDRTIDHIADRFQGRHLLDEIVGFFRTNSSKAVERMGEIKNRVADSASSATKATVRTVKEHPVPSALVGAGVAWMIYQGIQSRRTKSRPYLPSHPKEVIDRSGYEVTGDDYVVDEPGDHRSFASLGSTDRRREKPEAGTKDKIRHAADRLHSVASALKENVSSTTQGVRQRAGEVSSRIQETSRRAYVRSRDQVVDTVREHPVEVGLGLLALGVVVGWALPTPKKVEEVVGPRVARLRQRAKEAGQNLVDRSRQVVDVATDAARQEAQAQGLMPSPKEDVRTDAGLKPTEATVSSVEDVPNQPGDSAATI